MNSGGSPENCQKSLKKSNIDDFGGPSENPRKIVLGNFKIVKNHQNLVFLTTDIIFFDNNVVQKRGGGRRPPALFWERPEAATILLSKNSISVAQTTIFWRFVTTLKLPRTFFRRFSEGPPNRRFWIFFRIFDNSPGTLRNSSKYYFLTISSQSGIL